MYCLFVSDLPVQLRQPNLRPVGKLFLCDHFFLVHRIMLQSLEIQNGQKFQKPVIYLWSIFLMLHLFQKSALWLTGDLEGLFFSSGNAVIVQINGDEHVAKIHHFLSLRVPLNHELTSVKLLVKVFFYSVSFTDDELPVRDFWSGFVKVHNREIPNPAFVQVGDILRVVILDKSEDDVLTVADFERKSWRLLFSVIVPVYPVNGHMLLIQGEGINDIWYGHVHNTDYTRKTINVFFFVESTRSENVFEREARGVYSRNVVPWESVLGIAEGQWETPSRWR